MAAIVGPALAARLEATHDHDTLEVTIFLKQETAREIATQSFDAQPSRETRVDTMRLLAQQDQSSLRDYLEGLSGAPISFADGTQVRSVANVKPFWINNSIVAELSLEALQDVLERDDVFMVELVQHAPISELYDADLQMTAPAVQDATFETWSVKRINAPLVWQQGIDGTGVVVAVVDSGVNYNHPDLASRMWQSAQYPHHGYDFDTNDDDPIDPDGHGTCCAGIVAGGGESGKATGVAPGAQIMAIRVGGAEANFWSGLEFAILNGAHVISMSMTWKYPRNPDYPGWRRTCESILAAGLLHANSIGNQGTDLITFPLPYNIATPGNCPPPRLHPTLPIQGGRSSPISCGATSDTDTLANFSGRGPAAWEAAPYTDYPYQSGAQAGLIKPDICAPGPGTESCSHLYPAGAAKPYVSFGGTSAATPHVAGCLALLACACLRSGTAIVPERVQEALEETAVRIVGQTSAKENHFGAGRIDAKAAHDYGIQQGWW
jgi:subtilisin family serine protease